MANDSIHGHNWQKSHNGKDNVNRLQPLDSLSLAFGGKILIREGKRVLDDLLQFQHTHLKRSNLPVYFKSILMKKPSSIILTEGVWHDGFAHILILYFKLIESVHQLQVVYIGKDGGVLLHYFAGFLYQFIQQLWILQKMIGVPN